MKPFDARLLRYAKQTRGYIAFLVLLGIAITATIAFQTWLIASAATPVFYHKASWTSIAPYIWGLIGVAILRALLVYIRNATAHRSAMKVISQLRSRVLRHAGDLGERWLAQGNAATIVTQTTRGLDDLEPYFVSFLPELFLCTTATPLLIIGIATIDYVSALIIIFCIPLIPIFMILIGKMTANYSSQRLQAMSQLGTQLLDLLSGISTLKGLGREQGPKKRVRILGEKFADTTMQTLYVAFLSGAALEFIATLSTAIVAVEVGFRMVAGNLMLFEGLVLIMLTPEAFRPLREVGTQFHASTNGMAAAREAFRVLDIPLPRSAGTHAAPDLRTTPIHCEDISVNAPGRATVAPSHVNATITPGSIVALRGPSGAGKTTLASTILGLITPNSGRVLVGKTDLADIDLHQWWAQITWVPARPAIIHASVLENITGSDQSVPASLTEASRITGFSDIVSTLPQGWHTLLGEGGVGLSVGQRQRLALTRALISTQQLIILDEPSAHLDAMSEEYVIRAVRILKERGHTVVVIAHRAALANIADTVIDIHSGTRDMSEEITLHHQEEAERAAQLRREARQLADAVVPIAWVRQHPNSAEPGISEREHLGEREHSHGTEQAELHREPYEHTRTATTASHDAAYGAEEGEK